MNDDQMDHKSAQFVVRGLIKRFAPNADGNFDLQGPITSEDVEALRLLVRSRATRDEIRLAVRSLDLGRREQAHASLDHNENESGQLSPPRLVIGSPATQRNTSPMINVRPHRSG
jgi:hypothetical protein